MRTSEVKSSSSSIFIHAATEDAGIVDADVLNDPNGC